MAWCRPPAMLTARVASPRHTASAAASVAPATSALASCMPSKTGLSGVLRPYPVKNGSSRRGPHRGEVVGAVHPQQRVVVGRGRRDHAYAGTVEDAQLAGQRHGQLHAYRVERVVAEVVAEQRVVPDHDGVVGGHDAAPGPGGDRARPDR